MIFSLSALPVYLKPVGFLHISFYQFYKSPLCPIYSIRSCFFPILDKLRLSFNVQQIKPAHTHPGLQTKDTLAPSWRFSGNSTRPLGRCSRKAPQDFTGEKEPNRNNSSVWRKKTQVIYVKPDDSLEICICRSHRTLKCRETAPWRV